MSQHVAHRLATEARATSCPRCLDAVHLDTGACASAGQSADKTRQNIDVEAVARAVAAEVARHQAAPRLTLSIEEARAALGVSWDFWADHVAAEVRIVRRGRRKLVPVRELERWVEENAHAIDTGKPTPTAPRSPANGGVRASRAPDRTRGGQR